mmetsp:Transcript_37471/g.61593  ORF Transcript_37471/g.61593 Transcript_37471/m.61593 type:complete len:269 (-) Transcript_37471:82-888(-)
MIMNVSGNRRYIVVRIINQQNRAWIVFGENRDPLFKSRLKICFYIIAVDIFDIIDIHGHTQYSHIFIVECRKFPNSAAAHNIYISTQTVRVAIFFSVFSICFNSTINTKIPRRADTCAILKSSMSIANPWILIVTNVVEFWTEHSIKSVIIPFMIHISKLFGLSRLVRPACNDIKQSVQIVAIHGDANTDICVTLCVSKALRRIAIDRPTIELAINMQTFRGACNHTRQQLCKLTRRSVVVFTPQPTVVIAVHFIHGTIIRIRFTATL